MNGFSEIASLITTFGFPIFMNLWFMFRLEKTIKDSTTEKRALKEAFISQTNELRILCEELKKK